jgi:hypothetical protein
VALGIKRNTKQRSPTSRPYSRARDCGASHVVLCEPPVGIAASGILKYVNFGIRVFGGTVTTHSGPCREMIGDSRTRAMSCRWRSSIPRTCITLLLLLTFALQSFLVQTHIHRQSPAGPIAAMAASGASFTPVHNGDDKHAPQDRDDGHCPLCQAIVLFGSFLLPAIQVLPLPFALISLEPFRITPRVPFTRLIHVWQSRAPPTF